MKLAAGIAAAAFAVVGCAATDFTKEGASQEQFARDELLCRGQVSKMTAVQRNIEDSRQDTFRGDQERFGQTALPDTMSAMGDKRRTGKLMENCMQARGWQPKSQWWQRLGS
jgi:hypothetical protein